MNECEPESTTRLWAGDLDFVRPSRYLILTPDEPGAAPAPPRPILLALHGMGKSATQFLHVLRHLELSEMILVVPDGLYPFETRREEAIERGYAWYIYTGDQPQFRTELELTERHLLALLDAVEQRHAVDRARSVILGFSQGGYLAGFVALRNRARFGGLVIASARLKHEFLGDELAKREGLPATLFLHSERDQATPWAAVQEGKRLLEKAGAPVAHYLHDGGHRLPKPAIDKLGEWLGMREFDRARQENAVLKSVWHALDEGEPEKALERLAHAGEAAKSAEGRLAAAIAQVDLGEFDDADAKLRALEGADLDGEAEFLRRSHLAQTCYHRGYPQEGLDLLYTLDPQDPVERANREWWLGLSYDLLGRTDRADECFRRAVALDPEGAPAPIAISVDEAERVILEVVAELPEKLRAVFEELPVVLQDLPSLELIRSSHGEVDPDTLGLYVGQSLMERSPDHSGLPAAIYIYRRNLERFVETREEIPEQVRITLLHELGHHLGYDEDGLDKLGLA